MQVTYHLTEAEFDQNVFEAIKKAFKNRLLKISVVAEENANATATKEHNYAVSIPYDELTKITENFEEDDSFDIMGALEKFKVSAQ